MGHGETLKWAYHKAQAKAALQSEGRTEDVCDMLTGRHDCYVDADAVDATQEGA